MDGPPIAPLKVVENCLLTISHIDKCVYPTCPECQNVDELLVRVTKAGLLQIICVQHEPGLIFFQFPVPQDVYDALLAALTTVAASTRKV